jgi:hypothetical protein
MQASGVDQTQLVRSRQAIRMGITCWLARLGAASRYGTAHYSKSAVGRGCEGPGTTQSYRWTSLARLACTSVLPTS